MPFKNKEKKREYQKQYRKEHPGQRLKSDQKYRQMHHTEILEYQRLYYQQHQKEKLECGKCYRQNSRVKERERHQRYYCSIKGYLATIFNGIKQRCDNPKRKDYKWYGACGIRCLFKSLDDFRDYVMDVLWVDPRKLQIHRINSSGHYEKGNIEFLTPEEHQKKWRKK